MISFLLLQEQQIHLFNHYVPVIVEQQRGVQFMPSNIKQRADGRVEWVCDHGIGHTIAVPTNWPRPDKGKPDYRYIHGCDGCCSIYE